VLKGYEPLEAHDYKEGSIIEISAKRLRHSIQTAVRHYADLRTTRGQKLPGRLETPVLKMRDRGAQVSAKRQTDTEGKRRLPRTRRHGGIADPEGSAPIMPRILAYQHPP
jgi:hypothetical protein